MFADGVTMPFPPGKWAEGITQAREALRANPANAGSRAEWTPIRGGISADGQHGFTFGFMTVHRADSTKVPVKYMAYWVREQRGWSVAAYKRSGRPPGDVSLAVMAPSLPPRMSRPSADAALLADYASSLEKAEQSFSDEAQVIGLGVAFAKYGSADAANMGPGAGYVIGAEAIGTGIGGPTPTPGSPVVWKSDKVIVASSGDLGVSIGMIRSKENPAAPGSPFFTIWRRASPAAPWRYIAE